MLDNLGNKDSWKIWGPPTIWANTPTFAKLVWNKYSWTFSLANSFAFRWFEPFFSQKIKHRTRTKTSFKWTERNEKSFYFSHSHFWCKLLLPAISRTTLSFWWSCQAFTSFGDVRTRLPSPENSIKRRSIWSKSRNQIDRSHFILFLYGPIC